MSNTGRGGYHGGRGSNGRGKGGGTTAVATPLTPKPTGACAELGVHIFDFGPPEAAEQMATTWDRLEVHAVGRS
jgi:hypothetical protein